MLKLYAIRDNPGELYAQVEIDKKQNKIRALLDQLELGLKFEDWEIEDQLQGGVSTNAYYSAHKGKKYLGVITTKKIAFIIILGLKSNKKIKDIIFNNCKFV